MAQKNIAQKNEFAHMLGQGVYDETPKEVWAAIAISHMSIGGDWPELAAVNLAKEWQNLFDGRIVSQPVPKRVRQIASLARQKLIDQGDAGLLGPEYDEAPGDD